MLSVLSYFMTLKRQAMFQIHQCLHGISSSYPVAAVIQSRQAKRSHKRCTFDSVSEGTYPIKTPVHHNNILPSRLDVRVLGFSLYS